jgi:hypothetical protein
MDRALLFVFSHPKRNGREPARFPEGLGGRPVAFGHGAARCSIDTIQSAPDFKRVSTRHFLSGADGGVIVKLNLFDDCGAGPIAPQDADFIFAHKPSWQMARLNFSPFLEIVHRKHCPETTNARPYLQGI